MFKDDADRCDFARVTGMLSRTEFLDKYYGKKPVLFSSRNGEQQRSDFMKLLMTKYGGLQVAVRNVNELASQSSLLGGKQQFISIKNFASKATFKNFSYYLFDQTLGEKIPELEDNAQEACTL